MADANVGSKLGDTIRELRRKAHLTQEELAEGICSPVSVSRIECGRQTPSRAVLDALLERLGAHAYDLYGVFSKTDSTEAFDRDSQRVSQLIDRAQRSVTDRGRCLAEARDLLARLEERASTPRERRQCLLSRGSLLIEEAREDASRYEQALNVLERAVRQTKPDVDLSDLRHVALDPVEANCLALSVHALWCLRRCREAIRLGEELTRALDAMAERSQALPEHVAMQVYMDYDLAECLAEEGRYEEAREYVERGISLSLSEQQYLLLPELFYLKAKACKRAGEKDEALRIVRAVRPWARLIDKASLADACDSLAAELEADGADGASGGASEPGCA